MNKLKKILSSVLALGLVASTIVLPVSVKADDYIVNETFDGKTESNVLGTTLNYNLVPGNTIDTLADGTGDKATLGLAADDTVMNITGQNNYFNQNGLVGAQGWNQTYSGNHATYEYDVWMYNGWNKVIMSPGGNDRYGIYLGGNESAAKFPVYVAFKDGKYGDAVATVGRRQWLHVGVEYDYTVSPGVIRLYLNNEKIAEEAVLTTHTSVPTDMNFYSTQSYGHNFINNVKFYDGAYRPSTIASSAFTYYDFSDESQCAMFTPNATYGTSTQVDGFAGKAASDKVASMWGGGSGHNISRTGTFPTATEHASASFFGNFMFYNATNDGGARYGLKLSNGKLQIVTANGWTYEDIEGYTNVDMNSWHKAVIEINGADNKYYFYFDGVKVGEKTVTGLDTTDRTMDFRIQATCHIDDFRLGTGSYVAETPVSATSTAKVTVNGSVLNVAEGATADEVKAVVSGADSVIFYSDEDQTVVTDDVNAAKFMAVKKGNLYKSYEVKIQSPYGDKLLWLDFTDAADATKIGAAQVDGLAGKAASDKVAYASAQTSRSFLNGGNTVAITSGVVTYEASIYVPAGSTSIMHLFNGGGNSTRLAMKVQADGTVTIGETVSGAGVWDGINDTATTYGTVEANTWNKFAMELNANNGYAKFYINDNCVKTVNASFTLTAAGTQFAFETTNTYIDNMRMYTAPYVAGEPIAAVTGATDGVINVTEGTTVDAVKAMVTDGTPEVYTGATLETVASTVVDDSVLLIKKGELYKAYTINVASKYDGALYENKMDDLARVTVLTDTANQNYVAPEIVTNVAGRADNVAKIGTGNAKDGVGTWGQVWNTAGVMTVEAMVYNPNHNKVYIYPTDGGSASKANRLGVELSAAGKVGYYHNSWTAVDTGATYNMDKWTKVAYTLDYTAQTMKIYIDGVLVYTYSNVGMDSANFGKDIRFTPSNNNGTYLDNLRVYEGAYKGDEAIAAVAGAVDGVITMPMNSTIADVTAKVTDGTATVYKSDLTTVSNALADGDVLIINKGELYQVYALEVAGLYDDSYLLVGFESQGIVNEGTGFGTLFPNILYANNRQETNDEGETVNVSRKDEVTTSYVTGLGGKDSIVYKVTAPATETYRNVRFQTGYGNASAHVTAAGVYTYEADVYRGAGASNGASIMVKMRNAADNNNIQITLPTPSTGNRWYKLAITVDTVNKTVKGYINGVDFTPSLTYYGTDYDADTHEKGTLVFNSKDYTVVSDQVNVNFSDSALAEVVTATDNMRLYAGAYRGTTAPSMAASVTMAANSTVADVIAETGADFVVDANGNKVTSNAAAVATGYQAVKVDGEMFGYTAIEVEVAAADVVFSTLKEGEVYNRDGVDYVFVAVTTDTVDASLYDAFRVTDGTVVKEMSLDELMGTTLSGEAQIGVLVMNVPAANKANFQAKLVLAD